MRRPALLAVVVAGLALAGAGVTAVTSPPVAGSDNETVSAVFEDDLVATGTNTTLLVRTNADTVAIDSPDLSDERLHRVVEGEPSGGEVIANVSDGRVRMRFGECAPTGEHRFVVSDGPDRPNANATVEVVTEGDTDPSFARNVVSVRPGETTRIGVDSDCHRGDATLHVGSRSSGFLANATVNVSRGDSVVRLDTNATNTTDELFAAGPNATLTNTTLAEPADPPLPEGDYDLTLSVNGLEKDVAVLTVNESANREGRTTPTPTPSTPILSTPTATPNTPTAGPEPTVSISPEPPETTIPTRRTATPTDGGDGTPPVTSSAGQPGFGVGAAIVSIIIGLLYKRNR